MNCQKNYEVPKIACNVLSSTPKTQPSHTPLQLNDSQSDL